MLLPLQTSLLTLRSSNPMKRINTALLLLAFGLLNVVTAHAQVENTGSGGSGACGGSGEGLVNPLNGVCTLQQFLKAILKGVVEIGTIILVMMLVYVGFLFVAARGNSEKLQSAKSALLWTVIGGLILLGATAIQLVIEGTVNSLS